MAKKIVAYTLSTCSHCAQLKAYFKEHNIAYENRDVGEDSDAFDEMVKKSGNTGVPVVEIDGTIIVGFEKQQIARILGIEE